MDGMIRLHMVITMKKPNRKPNRIAGYDYSQSGAYFITICTQDRKKILSRISVGTPLPGCPQIPHDENGHPGTGVPTVELLWHGEVADQYIRQIDAFYAHLSVDQYIIMPDHIHFILSIDTDENGRTQFAPTISRVIKQFKGSITKQVGRPIWQKSFYDHGIRNQQDYDEIWAYIENNPLKYNMH